MKYIIGADEVGYGCLAGKLFVGAVRAPRDWTMPGLQDSKRLSDTVRFELTKRLLQLAEQGIISYELQSATNTEIDELGLGVCHKRCYARAINKLYQIGDQVIIDGNIRIHHFTKQGLTVNTNDARSVIKADDKYPTVMAASIIAKHTRDTEMIALHYDYPVYDWKNNVGYWSSTHIEAIRQHGLSPLHRKSYKIRL